MFSIAPRSEVFRRFICLSVLSLVIPCVVMDSFATIPTTTPFRNPHFSSLKCDDHRYTEEAFALRALGILNGFSEKWSAWIRTQTSLFMVKPWKVFQITDGFSPMLFVLGDGGQGESTPSVHSLAEKFEEELATLAKRSTYQLPVDLTEAYRLVGYLNAHMARLFSDIDLKRPPQEQWRQFFRLGLQTLVRYGRVLYLEYRDSGMIEGHGLVDLGSFRTFSYLGKSVYAVSINWLDSTELLYHVYEDIALVNLEGTQKQARLMYLLFKLPFTPRTTIGDAALKWLSRASMTIDMYAELCGVTRMQEVSLRIAKDHVFSALRANVQPYQVSKEDLAYILVKPHSDLQHYIQKPNLQTSLAQVKIGSFIALLAAQLAGIISELEKLLQNSATTFQKNLAYGVFLDYLQEIEANLHKEFVQHTGNVLEEIVTLQFFTLMLDASGVSTNEDLLPYFESGPMHPAEKVLQLLRQLYEANFYTDLEREEMLGLRAA